MPSANGLLQTILIPKDKFNLMKARKWLRDNNHSYYKIDVTPKFYRFRQVDPTPGSSYYTISLPDGIDLVYEKAKSNESKLIKEHKRLVKVLKEDKPKDIQLELKKQSSELKEMTEKKGYFRKMIEKKNAKDTKDK